MLLKSTIWSEEDALMEICGMLSAGEMTIREALNETLFELGKNKNVFEKCKLNVQNLWKKYGSFEEFLKSDEFQDHDYLNWTVKEVFRMSTPGIRSSGYKAF